MDVYNTVGSTERDSFIVRLYMNVYSKLMALRFTKFSSVAVTVGIMCMHNVCVGGKGGGRGICVTGAPTYRLSVVSGIDIPRNIYFGVRVQML